MKLVEPTDKDLDDKRTFKKQKKLKNYAMVTEYNGSKAADFQSAINQRSRSVTGEKRRLIQTHIDSNED